MMITKKLSQMSTLSNEPQLGLGMTRTDCIEQLDPPLQNQNVQLTGETSSALSTMPTVQPQTKRRKPKGQKINNKPVRPSHYQNALKNITDGFLSFLRGKSKDMYTWLENLGRKCPPSKKSRHWLKDNASIRKLQKIWLDDSNNAHSVISYFYEYICNKNKNDDRLPAKWSKVEKDDLLIKEICYWRIIQEFKEKMQELKARKELFKYMLIRVHPQVIFCHKDFKRSPKYRF